MSSANGVATAAPNAKPKTTELLPGIHYEDAVAHARDRIDFRPGGRVTTGFRPRASDTWAVGGKAARSLPAGSASGREILAASDPAGPGAAASPPSAEPGPQDPVVDGPVVDPSAPMADGASATLPADDGSLSLDGTRLRRQVFGFLPYWEVNDAVLDYEVLSTIAYFSVGSDRYGNLLKTNSDGSTTTGWSGWTSSPLTTIINAAHARGTRVVLTLSVFAWTSGQAATQSALLGSSTARLNLARQAAAAVRQRGADGINLDFEPIVSGFDDEFTAFVRTVRAELDKQAPGYQLTFDTTGYMGNYPVAAATAPGAADAVFIMGYDYRTAGTGYVGSIDPLSGPAYDLQDTINAFAAKVAPSKIILGIPWYGRAWSTVSDVVNAQNQSGVKFGASNSVIYDTAAGYASQYGRRWDSREQTPWIAYRRENCTATYGCVTSWRQIYYDDATSLKLRYDMINRMGLRGVGIWALGYDVDRGEMRQALAEKFLDDKTAPLAGIRTLARMQGSETFTVSWVGSDESGVRDYDVQVSIGGGPWHDWLTDTTATSASYAGADGYGFAFRVRARDTHLNVGAWDVSSVYAANPALAPGGFGTVVTNDLNVRSSPSTSASIVTTAASGTVVAVTGGPISADGFTWWKISLPITEWGAVGQLRTDVWVAGGNATTTHLAATGAPNSTLVDLPAGTGPAVGARFTGIPVIRLLDSRVGNGVSGAFTSGAARTFAVAGRYGVPAGAIAVTGTFTVVGQTRGGYGSLGPSAATVGNTSTINIPVGDIRAVGVTVKLASNGSLAAMWSGPGGSRAHFLFDATGFFVAGSAGATYVPLNPARLLDTRDGTGLAGAFSTGRPRSLQVTGHGGVGTDAVAVTGNLTVVRPTGGGYLFIGPTATSTPKQSSLNSPRADIRAASTTVKLDAGGRLGIVWIGPAGSTAHVLFDVTGYFVATGSGKTFFPIEPARLLDSRVANGLTGPFIRGVGRSFQTTGRGTIPVNAAAITGGVTVVGPTTGGVLTVWPAGTPLAATSTLNLPKGDIRANGVTVRAGAGGALAGIFQGGFGASAHVLLDATGYFR